MVSFKDFMIGDLFEVGTGSLVERDLLLPGLTPRISATSTNNGIEGYYSDLTLENYRTFENCVSVSFLGDSFYHDYNASFEMKIHTLNHDELNRYVGMYVSSACNKKFNNSYSYGNQLSSKVLKKEVISLPVQSISDTEPDWAYMEQYMKEIEKKTILKVKEENDREIARLKEMVGENAGEELEEVAFAEFRVGDLFNVTGTKSLDAGKLEFIEQGIRFIGRTQSNNGIQGSIKTQSFEPNSSNSITISQVGTIIANYQDKPFYTSQNIAKLENEKMDKSTGKYLVVAINKCLVGYTGYDTPTLQNIKDLVLTLPVHPEKKSEPYWEYMQRYIRSIKMQLLLTIDGYFSESLVS